MSVWGSDGRGGCGAVRECARCACGGERQARRGAPRQSAAASHARRLVPPALRLAAHLPPSGFDGSHARARRSRLTQRSLSCPRGTLSRQCWCRTPGLSAFACCDSEIVRTYRADVQ